MKPFVRTINIIASHHVAVGDLVAYAVAGFARVVVPFLLRSAAAPAALGGPNVVAAAAAEGVGGEEGAGAGRHHVQNGPAVELRAASVDANGLEMQLFVHTKD